VDSLRFNWKTESPPTTVTIRERPDLSAAGLAAKGENLFWLVDSAVAGLWPGALGEPLESKAGHMVMEASEEEKRLSMLLEVLNALHRAGANRTWRMVAVGGGVSMDIAALAASLYNRGMHLTLVPTTLLGMVDACLGGKTGVNLAGAKNQVGTVFPAERVAVFTGFTSTLPERELRNGMAEAVKTSVIADRGIAELLLAEGLEALPEIVRRCLLAKAGVIGDDLHDRGRRQLLNLGHTLGHALEGHSGFDLCHGEAVSLGMLAAAWMAHRLEGGCMYAELSRTARELGLPCRLRRRVSADEVMGYLCRDKKTVDGGRRWILPMRWEDCRVRHLSAEEELPLLKGALEAISP